MLSSHRNRFVLLVAVGLWVGCSGAEPTDPVVSGIALMAGGNPGGGGKGPAVNDTDPPGAPQDTTLNVRILGSGFDDGSVAEFTLNGVVDTLNVKTNSTQFVSENELVANITIDLAADTASYDVEVLTTRGKKGIGADLFQVVEKGNQAADPVLMPVDVSLPLPSDTAAGVVSDGRGVYVDDACGVRADADSRNSRDGSMILNPDERRIKKQQGASCGGTSPRFIEHRFANLLSGPGVPDTVQAFNILVVRAILSIPVGATVSRNVTLNDAKCGALGFNGDNGSVQASVTRQDENTWFVSATRGFCRNEGSLWDMPFTATITAQQ